MLARAQRSEGSWPALTPRRASVLAYVTNQLLHSHRAIERSAIAQTAEDDSPQIIIDLPRPARDDP
jgi:hypothetical protein